LKFQSEKIAHIFREPKIELSTENDQNDAHGEVQKDAPLYVPSREFEIKEISIKKKKRRVSCQVEKLNVSEYRGSHVHFQEENLSSNQLILTAKSQIFKIHTKVDLPICTTQAVQEESRFNCEIQQQNQELDISGKKRKFFAEEKENQKDVKGDEILMHTNLMTQASRSDFSNDFSQW
jgi:hypothetical protein